jgi:cytochrome c553
MRPVALAAALLVSPATAHSGSIDEKADICAACRGLKGLPEDMRIPIIWGQNSGYLYLQLRDLQKGERKVEMMSFIAHDVVKEDALELAEYFAAKPWPKNDASPASKADAATAAALNKSVPCTGCHFDQFKVTRPCRGLRASSATISSRR